jgi:glycosyltransferase involved in cell wall biosynthesis
MAEAAGKKRIAIVVPDLRGGGAERVVLASASDLAQKGHAVDIVLLGDGGELLELVPDTVRVISLKASRFRRSLPGLVRYLRTQKPDVVHAVMWPVTVIAVAAHRIAQSGAKLVVSDQNALSQQIPKGFQRKLLRWTARIAYPRADVRIQCSKGAAEDLARLSGLPLDAFEVIYNPISPPDEVSGTVAIKRLWKGGRPRLITVGSFKAQKNHALLLRAFARVDNKSATLLILGEGELRSKLERLAAELGIADRVIMPGFAVDPWPYLASAEIFVLSSDYEGFPLVLAEAMYAGLKIVSTDCISGPNEMLDGGRYGRLVPCRDEVALAEAIKATIDDAPQPERMRARAKEMAGPGMVERYSELLLS